MTDWDPDAFDAEVKAERRKDKRLQPMRRTLRLPQDETRGLAIDQDLKRRQAADRAMRKAQPTPEQRRQARAQRPGTVRWPRPKQKPNGRWEAKCIYNGKLHTRTFDTKTEAEQFIRQVKEGK